MIKLELTVEDARVIAEVLDADIRELSYEIANTDAQDFRDVLKKKKVAIGRVLDVLGSPTL